MYEFYIVHWRAYRLFSDLVFLISFIHQVLIWANIFKGHLGPLALTFCGPHKLAWGPALFWPLACVWAKPIENFGKSILQVPDTGTRVLANTGPFLRSSIVSFWITPARSKGHKYHIFMQYWYTRNVPVFTNTGTFQYLGPEVYFFQNFHSHAKPHPLNKNSQY